LWSGAVPMESRIDGSRHPGDVQPGAQELIYFFSGCERIANGGAVLDHQQLRRRPPAQRDFRPSHGAGILVLELLAPLGCRHGLIASPQHCILRV